MENYGDVNWLEHGGIFVEVTNITEVNIITVNKEEEGKWRIANVMVDIADEWINWQQVNEYGGLNEDSPMIDKAIIVLSYYGTLEFGDEGTIFTNEEEVKDYIADIVK